MKVWKQEEWAAALADEMENGPLTAEEMKAADENWGSPSKQTESAEERTAREKAVYYLQFSGKTENELRKKLADKEFSPASIDYAIDFVKRYRYLDDEDYTRRFLERNRQKKSRKQMIFELTQKGVSKDILNRVLEDVPVDEEAQIMTLLEKRGYPGAGATREEKQKISVYLGRKGFSYDAISSALIQFARKISD